VPLGCSAAIFQKTVYRCLVRDYQEKQKRLPFEKGRGGDGMSTLTMVHVGLSLIGIAAGFLVIFR